MMASTSITGVEILKFGGKNFALWKEMMQDVSIVWRQIEAIRRQIARSTIKMHLAENVYLSMAKEMTAYALWKKL